MPDNHETTPLRLMFRIVWQLLCVAMLTAFLGLVAVHNDYYSESPGDDSLFWAALGGGAVLSIIVVVRPIVSLARSKKRQSVT